MLSKEFENFLNDKITDFSEITKNIGKKDITQGKNLDTLQGIGIGIASPEYIRSISHGKVLISETINYRTQRPERGGLFCEQIFGPRKNYECACGKYKRIRYKGVVCERCGVEVTSSSVRRERMGHIDLHAPVVHIWYLRSVPSRIGLLLDIPMKKLEQVVYFAAYIVTDVYEEKLKEATKNLEDTFKRSKGELQRDIQKKLNILQIEYSQGKITENELRALKDELLKQLDDLQRDFDRIRMKLKLLAVGEVLNELDYRLLYEKFPHVFEAGTGAECIKKLLQRIDLEKFIADQQEEFKKAPMHQKKKILQKIKLASSLLKSGQKPEWFVLEVIPVIPPDLRPMIQLDGGRYASADLNDLYRRVINRNNRLKKLMELGAPEIILKNEKRMLQEAVDMLIMGETRTTKNVQVNPRRPLKSLTEILKGKQGRFRQNLLGKRVDYSGRSVIVVGPSLKMDECGLPKVMALTLFKTFIAGKLIQDGHVYTFKHAEKFIEEGRKEVWDALDEIIREKYVLLNRAPTLHRLSIQAFRPVLIDGKAIQLHPLTCTAFNADFDGDQMAVHVPLTEAAQEEAKELMVTSKNLLSPASGEPIVVPSQDMILGCYYVTQGIEGGKGEGSVFASIDDAYHAYEAGAIDLRAFIKVRMEGKLVETTYGRILFNSILPKGFPFVNEVVKKNVLKKLIEDSFNYYGNEVTARFIDRIKDFGYYYSTVSGLSISIFDMLTPSIREELFRESEEKIKFIQKKHWLGFLTDNEKYVQSIKVWAEVKKIIEAEIKKIFHKTNHIFNLVDSGARGNWGNITQLCGMKGLVVSTTGKTIELPIKSTLKEGFSTLEYFISTHGGRKGKSDTALKTAQSGYLTRRLVDAAQSILVKEKDCGTLDYIEIVKAECSQELGETFEEKLFGKTIAKDVLYNGNVLFSSGTVIDKMVLKKIVELGIESVCVRSILLCRTEGGVCQMCYGLDLGLNQLVDIGTPVGIIAAQSIGEPGTQLTMRTFHSGGVVKEGGDMTQGLTRVEELFEARNPKNSAIIADIDGVVHVYTTEKNITLHLQGNELEEHSYYFPSNFLPVVKVGQEVAEKQLLARNREGKGKILSQYAGIVKKVTNYEIVVKNKDYRKIEYLLEPGTLVLVKTGDTVVKGQKLTEGNIPLIRLRDITGVLPTQQYIVREIKAIYASQGQTVHSKHIELIVRQMFSKVRVLEKGNSVFFPGDIVDIITFEKERERVIREGKTPPSGERLLLGITKISLYTESWLSAASFQETVRVLVEASISGKIDKLKDLKENVIIGRLIPAGKQYKKIMGYMSEEGSFSEEKEYFDKAEVL